MKIIKNPYLNRVMIKNIHDFFGRKKELRRIFSRISAYRPQSISIVGIPRIGKSSLLYYISQQEVYKKYIENWDKYLFIMIDLQGKKFEGKDGFFKEAILKIKNSVKELNFEGNLDSEGFLKIIEKLEKMEFKVILLLDEFESITMNESFGEGFFSFLRSIANKYNFAYITSSNKELQKVCHTSKVADSPFFNIFSTLHLYTFNREEAYRLIEIPSEREGLPLKKYRDKIVEMAGFFPFFIQIACSSFFDYFIENENIKIDGIVEIFYEEAKEHFRYYYEHFSDEEKHVVENFVKGTKIEEQFLYVERELEKKGFIINQGNEKKLFSYLFKKFLEEEIVNIFKEKTITTGGDFNKVSSTSFYPIGEGEKLGNFKIVKKLGEGGMGVVFEGFDILLERKVAIKVIHPQYLRDESFLKRFMREAKYASKLNHPNICTIYQIGEHLGLNFIVMEYIEGEQLKKLLKAGPFKIIPALKILIQIAEGLEYAHKNGIIHRDIKSSNIMVENSGLVKILDFGLVKSIDKDSSISLTKTGGLIGTPQYMSPEQILGKKVDKRSDIFSFGIVMYELLTGNLPFNGENYMELINKILNKEPFFPQNLPFKLKEIIHKCLKKDPSKRFGSFSEIKKVLSKSLNDF